MKNATWGRGLLVAASRRAPAPLVWPWALLAGWPAGLARPAGPAHAGLMAWIKYAESTLHHSDKTTQVNLEEP